MISITASVNDRYQIPTNTIVDVEVVYSLRVFSAALLSILLEIVSFLIMLCLWTLLVVH